MKRKGGPEKLTKYRVYFSQRSTCYVDIAGRDATHAGLRAERRVREDPSVLQLYSQEGPWLVDHVHELDYRDERPQRRRR